MKHTTKGLNFVSGLSFLRPNLPFASMSFLKEHANKKKNPPTGRTCVAASRVKDFFCRLPF